MSSRNSARKRSAPGSGAKGGKPSSNASSSNNSNNRQSNPQSDRRSKNDDSNINWEYDSDELASDDDGHPKAGAESASDEEELAESAQEKRARMAKEYIDELTAQGLGDEASEDDGNDSDDSEGKDDVQGHDAEFRRTNAAAAKLTASGAGSHAAINAHLQRDVLRAQGRLRSEAAQKLGDALSSDDRAEFKQYKGHRLPATCIALSDSEEFAITGSKDAGLIRWDVETGKKLNKFPGRMKRKTDDEDSLAAIGGHHDEVLSCAMSSDDRYLATGGRDNLIYIWDVRSCTLIDRLQGHRDAVMGLAFRRNTHQLLSASSDRSVRVWNAADLSFVEALYGHQAEINAVACLYRDRAVSVSNDRSLRMWKIPEETQLVLKGHHKASLDCVAMVDEVHFVAGSQDGAMSLWHTSKKKPLAYIPNAHGSPNNWITSLASIHNTDVVVSGSNDGWVKLWQADCDNRALGPEPVGQYKVPGFVNGLACGSSGRVILAATGQEHRLGRWERDATGKNGLHIARLDVSLDTQRGGSKKSVVQEESSDEEDDRDQKEKEEEGF